MPTARVVASVELPREASRDEVFGRLAGRWFGPLRWVGVFDRPHDPWLVWSVGESSAHVLLSVRRGKLRVLTENGAGPADRATIQAAYTLLRHAVDGRIEALSAASGRTTAFLAEAPFVPFTS